MTPGDIRPIPDAVLRQLRANPREAKQALALWIPQHQEGQPVRSGQGFANAVTYGWRRNELVFACIMKTAKARAGVTLRARDPRTGDELPEHPLRQLLRRPNPHMSEFGFHAAVTIYQKLSGHSYWEVVRSRAGVPVQLWPLRPDWVKPVLSSRGLLGWEYGPPGRTPARLEPQNVIDIPIFDPMSLFGATSPAMVAGYAGDIDNAVSQFAKDLFERGALPAGVLTTDQWLDTDQVSEVRAGWNDRYGGAANWVTAPAVLVKGTQYQRIGLSFDELGLEALDSRNEARICMVMDIPPIIVGANVGLERATYSNYEQADTSWWRSAIVPDLKHEADALQATLGAEFGDVELVWDFADVTALQEDQDALWKRAGTALDRGRITLNQFLDIVGLDQIPNGDIYYVPSNVKVVPAAELGAKLEPEPQPDPEPEPAPEAVADAPLATSEEETP